MNKIFTIIICTYNSGKKIIEVIDNIISQKSFCELVNQIILVDNCSNEENYQYLKKCLIKDKHIKYIFEKKQGLSHARKTGVNATESEWIIFIDDDNIMHEKWIETAYQYIIDNPNVGAFNGCVIPKMNYKLSENEKLVLQSSLKVLACTHYNEDDLIDNCQTPFRIPIGAGLVIKASPLKKYIEQGWLKSTGRKGDELTSGDDSEMSLYVKQHGYEFGFCYNIIIDHLIPKERLNVNYLDRLWYEIGKGMAKVVINSNFRYWNIWVYYLVIKSRLLFLFFNKSNQYKYKFYKKYCLGYINGIKNKL